LTIDESQNNTNSVHQDHKKLMEKFLNVQGEIHILDKVLDGLHSEKYQLDFSKNNSLQHFIKKLQEFKIKNGK
jgi:virulence-associated protein VapD